MCYVQPVRHSIGWKGSEVSVVRIVSLLHGHALHLDEPSGAADGCEGDDKGDAGKLVGEHLADDVVVSKVSQIDDDLHDIVEGHATFVEECFNVFPHTQGLLLHIAHM